MSLAAGAELMAAGRRDDLEMAAYVDRVARQIGSDIREQIKTMHEVGVRNMADYEMRLREIERQQADLRVSMASSAAVRRAIAAAIGSPIVAAGVTWLITRAH